MNQKVLFYPSMAKGSKLDHYSEDYLPVVAELDKHNIPHAIVNSTDHKLAQFRKVYNEHKPTDVFFRLPGIEKEAIEFFKRKGCKTYCILHGWPSVSGAHLPVNVDKFFIWGEITEKFFLQQNVKTKLIITGSPRFDTLYNTSCRSKKSAFIMRCPVVGFASIPWHHWVSADGAQQRYEYAKALYKLSSVGFPIIKQRFHPIEQNEGWYKKYKSIAASMGRYVEFSSPYDQKFSEWLVGIDIMVTTQSGSVIEAAFLGVPTVCMSFFGKKDYVQTNEYGLSTKITSSVKLQEALVQAYYNIGKINPTVYQFNKYFDGQSARRIVDCVMGQ